LLEGTTGTVSGEFFQGVVASLASCLELQTAFVSELVAPDRVRLLALWHAGALRDGLEYTLPGTPCAAVIEENRAVHLHAVQRDFPDDSWLAEVGAHDYISAPVVDREGRPIGHLGVIHGDRVDDPEIVSVLRVFAGRVADEIQRQRFEERLADQAKFSEAVITRAAEGICVCHDVPEFPYVRFTTWNDRMTEITGYTMDQINVRGWYQSLYPDPELQASARARMQRMREGHNLEAEPWKITRADGVERFVEISTSVLPTEGGAVHVLALMQDVTERRLRENELVRLKEFHEELVNATSEGIAIFDSEQRWTYVNPAGAAMLGYQPEELIGRPGAETVVEDDLPVMNAADDRRAEGISDRYELVLRHRDGRRVPVLVSAVPRMEGSTFSGSLSVFTDLSALRRAEEERHQLEGLLRQSQRLEALGTLAGGIAHDFNNILAIMLGSAELALSAAHDGEPPEEDLNEIVAAGRRARELVQQILIFSHRSEERLEPVRLSPAVKEAMKLLRQTLPSTIEIRAEVEGDCPKVAANSTQIHQVLLNLCTNAAHALKEGGGVLEVRLDHVLVTPELARRSTELKPGDFVRLSVRDTGVGMSAATLERAFEPYFTTKPTGEGTGLGLAVVRGIIRSHGGAIDIESQLGKGTTVDVYFPVVVRTMTERPPPGPSSAPRGRERVLVVDDEPLVARVHKRLLASLGYDVQVATSSEEALSVLQSNPARFDLLFTDQTMPGLTGVELARQVRTFLPKLPIVLCTGFQEWINARQVQQLGVSEIVDKPTSRDDLAAAIRRALDAPPTSEMEAELEGD